MVYILTIIIGVVIGMISKNKIVEWIKSTLIIKRNHYKVKFHVYFVVHQSGNKLNEMLKTDTIEVSVNSKTEDEAIEFLKEMINNEARIEIESVDICN